MEMHKDFSLLTQDVQNLHDCIWAAEERISTVENSLGPLVLCVKPPAN